MEELEVEIPPHKSRVVIFSEWINNPKVRQTIVYCACFWLLGMALAAPGPALLSLAHNTHSSVSAMGYIYVARSIGYLLGSAFGGPLFDKFNGNLLVSGGLVLTCVGNFFTPMLSNLILLALCVSLTGLAMGFLDIGGNITVVWIWGSEVGPYMQSLHFSFGLGALISPSLVGLSIRYFGDPLCAFWFIALLGVPFCLLLLKFKSVRPDNNEEGSTTSSLSIREMIVLGLASTYLLFANGAEISSGGYLTTFAVKQGLTSQTNGAYLTSLFWGMFTAGRLTSIPVSVYLSSATIIAISLIGCTICTVIWTLFSDSKILLWLVVPLYGYCISVAYPTAITLTEAHISLTGKLTSILVIGSSFGEMLIPLGVAVLLDTQGPIYLIWMLLFCALAGLACYGGIITVGRPLKIAKQKLKYQPLQLENDT